jgi:predicted metalloprotease
MRWSGGRRSGNIDDRRGMGGGVAAGGIGAGGLVLAAIAYFVFGVSPEEAMNIAGSGGEVSQQAGKAGSPEDEAGAFVDVIETSTTDVWRFLIKGYEPTADVVLYDGATGTACGTGQAAMGPFYCPSDQKVYLDLTFWRELETSYGARGEFARAYVIAHEIGHHVQNLTGEMARGRRQGARGEESGSVRTELQADCYAGVWAAHAPTVSHLDIQAADIESGLAAASGVGDDTLQRKTQGRVVPDSFTHGSSAQRMRWFKRGYDSGDPESCDTFRAATL